MGFHHPSCAERAVVFAEARRGASQRDIARCLGRSASTICRELRRSLTCDRGLEVACHPEPARRLKIDIWFCNPHAP